MPETADNNSLPLEEPQAAAYDPAVAGVQAAHRLEQSGFGRRQAAAVVVAVRELTGDLATKNDLAMTQSELRVEIAEAKNELKTDIAELGNELKTCIAELGNELKTEITGVEGRVNGEIAGLDGKLSGEIVAIKKIMDTTMATKQDLAQMQIQQTKDAFRNTLWTVGIIVGTLLAGMGVATAILIAVMMRLSAA